MRECIICEVPLNDENKSKEHIIHNAIGGSLEDEEIYSKRAMGCMVPNKTRHLLRYLLLFWLK